jgi:cation transport regulator ChaB
MPTTKEDLPSTIKRSPKKVQRTYAETLDSAHESYDSEERAHRAAWASVKHVAEKKGDHWEPKPGDRKGPSDEQASRGGRGARDRPRATHGGVDVEGRTRDDLYKEARRRGIRGASKMRKRELGDALERANDRETAAARS